MIQVATTIAKDGKRTPLCIVHLTVFCLIHQQRITVNRRIRLEV